jgi:hypothetical protein
MIWIGMRYGRRGRNVTINQNFLTTLHITGTNGRMQNDMIQAHVVGMMTV